MKITGNEPAMARPYSHDERPSGKYEGDYPESFQAFTGLTIRQYYAGLAMQGFIATYGSDSQPSAKESAKFGVEAADALIEELNKL